MPCLASISFRSQRHKADRTDVYVNPANISLDILQLKAQDILKELGGYEIEYRGYSLEDVLE